jgi:putative addiction module component (TIGR02574 family)
MDRPDLSVLDRLPTSERIRVLQDLWDRIAARPDDIKVPQKQIDELVRREAEDDRDPDAAIPWDHVRKALRSSGK